MDHAFLLLCMPDIANFILSVEYFFIPVNILEFCSVVQLNSLQFDPFRSCISMICYACLEKCTV